MAREDPRVRLARWLETTASALPPELEPRQRRLRAGEVWIERGASPRAFGLLELGRLEARSEDAARVLEPGSTLAEAELLAGRPADARILALRESWILELDAGDFDRLLAREGAAALAAARRVAQQAAPGRGAATSGPPRVALLPAHAGLRPRLRALASGLGEAAKLDVLVVEGPEHLAAPLPALREDPSRLARALAEREAGRALSVLVCDAEAGAWTCACVGSVDEIVLAVDETSPTTPGLVEDELLRLTGRRPTQLLRLHPAGTRRAHATRRWLDPRPWLRLHHHLAEGAPADLARLARSFSGRARGLVLSGGGARCFAHIGVIAALAELGVAIDVVAGSSSGASVAAALAAGHELETLRERVVYAMTGDSPLGTPTLPLVSLRDSRRTARIIEEVCEGREIEDLWLPYVCVSTNLNRAQLQLHRRGSLARALLASGSMPVIMPPVVYGQELLCDGGLLDNLPVEPARSLGARRVIASDVSRDPGLGAGPQHARLAPGFRGLLAHALALARGQPRPPGLLDIAYSTMATALSLQRRLPGRRPELLLRPPVTHFALDDFSRHAELEARARAYTLAQRASILSL